MAGWQDGRDRMVQLFVDYSYWLIIGYCLFRDANVTWGKMLLGRRRFHCCYN
jgi:hypothetical protein